MDDFFEEIKNRQDNKQTGKGNGNDYDNGDKRSELPDFSDAIAKGSFDNGDPNTTNLYLGNLAPCTTGTICNDI